uniref:Uncharacterized protein n=1 Tax=Clastoptera arizonana TaxID=38151 RepID=A0A1B6CQR0_9HEMI
MTDLLIQSASSASQSLNDSYHCRLLDDCRSPILGHYSAYEERSKMLGLCELKHSKSDDLILQSAPISAPEMYHGISDVTVQIQKEACVVYEDDLVVPLPQCLPGYYSDSEVSSSLKCPSAKKTVVKITGDFGSNLQTRRIGQHLGLYDRLDPEDSIRDMISENDFYRFVLFKRHYEKYLDISQKYEEARNIAYYLEEKYHEIKTERDKLAKLQQDLERKVESQKSEMHDKDEELFLQLEKGIRLEEDCEKLRTEKDLMISWKNRLEKEKNEAYRQLKLQAEESESTRRRLERARNDVVKQVTAIAAEKDSLEQENIRLNDVLKDIERKSSTSEKSHHSVVGLKKEVFDLKLFARQSATLNSQLKKGMKHLATCRKRKCSVCAYTRSTFGEYSGSESSGKRLFSCFQTPFADSHKHSHSLNSQNSSSLDNEVLTKRLSGLSVAVPPSRYISEYSSSPLPNMKHMSYIDEGSSSCSDGDCEQEETQYPQTDTSITSLAPHAFSSDSGFSSEPCDSTTPAKSVYRATKWTSSFRKLIRRVSKRQISTT